MNKQKDQSTPSLQSLNLAAMRTAHRHEDAHRQSVNHLLRDRPRLRAPDAPTVN